MTAKTKILLVDDEGLVRDELGEILVEEGYEVVSAADGEEGLARFRSEQPHMVITDVRMPKIDGMSLVTTIRSESPITPVTVITGHGSEQMAIEALRAGVTDFLKKPVRIDGLLSALARMETALLMASDDPTANLPPAARLVEHSRTYQLENDRRAIPTFVDRALSSCMAGIDRSVAMELSLALRELILNAVEHGNLGLTYEEKTRALESGTFDQVLDERAARAPFARRRVQVTIKRRLDDIDVEVVDEGEGFDWRALPDPTDPERLLADHGRGVLLARMSVDELVFNERGNAVKVVKRFKRHPGLLSVPTRELR